MLLGAWNFAGPVHTGLGVFPAAWSNDPVSAMWAPAGMSRIEFFKIESTAGIAATEPSGAVAAVFPVGSSGFHLGTGAGWDNEERIGAVQLSGSYVIAGDPIGFMEGLFGPSITAGVSTRYQFADTTHKDSFDVDAGLQFSLFPSFALGFVYTDIIEDGVLATGFSQVFNRNLKAHAGYSTGGWQAGCELTVTRSFKVFSGVDCGDVHAGLHYSNGGWGIGYGAVLHTNEVEHSFGISRRFS